MDDRHRGIRSLPKNFQEKRRHAALQQQVSNRYSNLDALRGIKATQSEDLRPQTTTGTGPVVEGLQTIDESSVQASEAETSSFTTSPTSSTSYRERFTVRQFWANQMMIPEWMIEIPSDLSHSWLVMPRPEGQRCLVIAERGLTVARRRNGIVRDRFESSLPGGGQSSRMNAKTVLDCVFYDQLRTYFVTDLVSWKGQDMRNCTAEFRLYWCATRLQEELHGSYILFDWSNPTVCIDEVENSKEKHGLRCNRFASLPLFPATQDGLLSAYSQPMPFQRDGLFFIHSKAQYQAGLITPLALLWKDSQTSRYAIDTDAAGIPLVEQQVVLRYVAPTRAVATSDYPPIVLATLPEDFVRRMGESRLHSGLLLRFQLGNEGVAFDSETGEPRGAQLHFLGVANQARGHADSLSRIVFQWMLRRAPLSFESLLRAAATPSEPSQGCETSFPDVSTMESIGVDEGFRQLVEVKASSDKSVMKGIADEGSMEFDA